MMFFNLKASHLFSTELSLDEDGIESYVPNMLTIGQGREVHYEGEAVGSIFAYEGTDDVYVLTRSGRELCMSIHEDIPMQLVQITYTTVTDL